jgi:hypothetical protein
MKCRLCQVRSVLEEYQNQEAANAVHIAQVLNLTILRGKLPDMDEYKFGFYVIVQMPIELFVI